MPIATLKRYTRDELSSGIFVDEIVFFHYITQTAWLAVYSHRDEGLICRAQDGPVWRFGPMIIQTSRHAMQVVLVMFKQDGTRRDFPITRDMTVVGRREDCDIRIPVGDVSRKHCRFIREGDTIRLEDLGSSNGTYHNGQKVQEAELQPGDSLQIGPALFTVQIDGVPADEDLHAPDAVPQATEGGSEELAEFDAVEEVSETPAEESSEAPANEEAAPGEDDAAMDFVVDEPSDSQAPISMEFEDDEPGSKKMGK